MNTPAPNSSKPSEQTAVAISLKMLCKELKLDPRFAREKLRLATREPKKFPELYRSHKPNTSWAWVPGSLAEKEARSVLRQ